MKTRKTYQVILLVLLCILGNVAGRTSDEDITIYDPAGMALLDIAAAKVALDLAEAKGLGAVVEL